LVVDKVYRRLGIDRGCQLTSILRKS